MVLLIEIFWSLADTLFSIKTARKSYGLVLAIGSIGGVLTNLLVGVVSSTYGTHLALLGVVPCLGGCALLTWSFSRSLGGEPVFVKSPGRTFGSQSLTVVRNSRYLVPLLFLIAVVQISISLIDLQYARVLESTYTDLDTRTGVIGQIDAAMNIIATVLQFFAGYIIKILGMGGVFVGIPLVLGTALVGFIAAPQILAAAILKVTSKCFDYSVFRASKEMLYIPLSRLEKTQGKALIDILIYRIAKSSAALLMIFLLAIGFSGYTMHITLCLMLAWILLAVVIVKRYKSVIDLYNEEI
ncbi:MAG: Npt1/Npt2 family nucleotide transporter [Myxococcaceae bacterium]